MPVPALPRRRPRAGPFGVAAVALAAALAVWAAPDALAAPRPAAATVAGAGVNARDTPGLAGPVRYRLPAGAPVAIDCQLPGDRVAGLVRDTDRWDRLRDGRYVSDAYVRRTAASGWVAPVPGPVGSGFRTAQRPGHNGVDLVVPRGTPVRAAAAGTVLTARCAPATGDCDVDGSLQVAGCGWYVELAHAGGWSTRYCHLLHAPPVRPGEAVAAGTLLGYAGTSGNSDGPHLHFEVHAGVPPVPGDAVDPVPFLAARGVSLAKVG